MLFSEDFTKKPNSRVKEKRKDSFELNVIKKMRGSRVQKNVVKKYNTFDELDGFGNMDDEKFN